MVRAMVRGPPERTAHDRHSSDEREQELKDTSGLEGPVREITMKAGGHTKRAGHEGQRDEAHEQGRWVGRGVEREERPSVN
jgi:hypothetical protein